MGGIRLATYTDAMKKRDPQGCSDTRAWILRILVASCCFSLCPIGAIAEPEDADTHISAIRPITGHGSNVPHRASGRRDRASRPSPIEYFDAHSAALGVKLNWAAFSDHDVDGFHIYRRRVGDSSFIIVNGNGLVPPWQQDYTDNGPRPATTYQYILGVACADGSEQFSAPVEVTTPSGRKKSQS